MMLPPFDLQGGAALALVRGGAVAAMLSAFGTLVFRAMVAPRSFVAMTREQTLRASGALRRLTWASLAAALLLLLIWLGVESAVMADAETLGGTLAAMRTVLARTYFGHLVACQFAALLGLASVVGWRGDARRQVAAAIIAVPVLALQAGHSHAWSMFGGVSLLLLADVVHLLAAGAWLGALVPLIIIVAIGPPQAGALAARYFSPLGKWCVGALLVTAAYQGWVLVASLPGLAGTAYGWLVLVKTALYVVLLGFAVSNRYVFAPALLRPGADAGKAVLIRSIGVQTAFSLAVVAAASVLSGLPPSMHEQAVWPFSQRFSLDAVREDADFLREVLLAGGALAAVLLIAAITLWRGRLRLPAMALAAVVAALAVPHFDLLLVPAYPTSFYHSPTRFAASSIAGGEAVYARNCAACHGAHGHGDGEAAADLPVPPADLTAAHLWMHSDGELYWWVSHGIAAPDGSPAMPGFTGTLDDDQIWAVIDFIHAQNGGETFRRTGRFPAVLRAPGFDVRCGGEEMRLADLRGKFVHLLIGVSPVAPDGGGVVTIVAAAGDRPLPHGVCSTRDDGVTQAYAIVAGMAPGALSGSEFLIDTAGWMRAMRRPGDAPAWRDPAMLQAEIQALRTHPVASAPAPPMDMKM